MRTLSLLIILIISGCSSGKVPNNKIEQESSSKEFPNILKRYIKEGVKSGLADFSHAGYVRYDKRLSFTEGRVFDVTDYGAVADDDKDDTKAIQKAVDMAGESGGGVVLFPKGKFNVNMDPNQLDIVRINHSNIVLRGSGSGEDGTVIFSGSKTDQSEDQSPWLSPFIFHTGLNLHDTYSFYTVKEEQKYADIVEPVEAGSDYIKLSTTEGLKPGDMIIIAMQNTTDEGDLIKHLLSPLQFEPFQTTYLEAGINRDASLQYIIEIEDLLDNGKVRLVQPIHHNILMRFKPYVAKTNMLRNIGVEHFKFESSWSGKYKHHGDREMDYGWGAVCFHRVAGGWINDLHIDNYTQTTHLVNSRNVTMSNVTITGGEGHYGPKIYSSSDNLIQNYDIQAKRTHGPGLEGCSFGNVYKDIKQKYPAPLDLHGIQNKGFCPPMYNLYENITNASRVAGGAAPKNIPHASEGNTFWNIQFNGWEDENYNELFYSWIWRDTVKFSPVMHIDCHKQYLRSVVVGAHNIDGKTLTVEHDSRDRADNYIYIERLNRKVDCSVYDEQVKLFSPSQKLKNNPFTKDYIEANLNRSLPRLVFTPEREKVLIEAVKNDSVIGNLYSVTKQSAYEILDLPLIKRKKVGRRILQTSRDMLYRINTLGVVYRVERDPKLAERVDQELLSVCNFIDWNRSHFLDVAEMCMAVSLAIDWFSDDLPQSTIDLAKRSLIEKGIMQSWNENLETPLPIAKDNNWNQVCNAGLIAASIAIADIDAELAAKTIDRSLKLIPTGLAVYGPDGVYPEGASYWRYGTSFSIMTDEILRTAFGYHLNFIDFPGVKESATFRKISVAPSGQYYNFADCSDEREHNGDVNLAWFATQTGVPQFYETERFMYSKEKSKTLFRLIGASLIWMSEYEEKDGVIFPTEWIGDGVVPVALFMDGRKGEDNRGFFMGTKGACGSTHHGNMDSGSFVFELDGVRWVVDPGNQSYTPLEQAGLSLWDNSQNGDRWKLLTKNNYGHSTITVDDKLHVADGRTEILEHSFSGKPEVTLDMSRTFEGQLSSITRRFQKDSDNSITIKDRFIPLETTEKVTWQILTTADVEVIDGGLMLRKRGKQIKILNRSHPDINFNCESISNPSYVLDKKIDNLKRIKLTLEGDNLKQEENIIEIKIGL